MIQMKQTPNMVRKLTESKAENLTVDLSEDIGLKKGDLLNFVKVAENNMMIKRVWGGSE